MPIKYRRYRRRRTALRRKGLNKSQYKAIRTIASKVVHKNQELKYTDYSITGINPNYSGSFYPVDVNLARGTDDFNEYIGDKITPTGLWVSSQIYANAGGSTNLQNMRMFVFVWKGDTASDAPTMAEIFKSSLVGGGLAAWAPYNHDHRKKFKILYDRTFHVASDGGASSNFINVRKFIKFNQKRVNHVIRYNGGAIQGLNRIYVGFISNLPSAPSGYPPNVFLQTRLWFRDA